MAGRPRLLAMSVRELTRSDRQRLAAEPVVWLCTLRPDGSPHLTPVWFCYLDAWWISCASRNVKVANLEQDPRASLALPDGDRPLVAEGTAEIHRGTYPSDVTTVFASKYDGWDITDHVHEGPRVLIRVQVQRWLMTG